MTFGSNLFPGSSLHYGTEVELSIVFLKLVHMKTEKRRAIAKGDRLNWTRLEDVNSMKLSLHMKGQVLTLVDLKARQAQPSKFILVH